MLSITDFRNGLPDGPALATALPRAEIDITAALKAIEPTMQAVKTTGATALRDLSEQFDGVRPQHLRVPPEEIKDSLKDLDPQVYEALHRCIKHNRCGHQAQKPASIVTTVVTGGEIKQRWIPVRRVGLYVPGGLAVYPSSVVMNVVAAQVAGVREIALASPPQKAFGGKVHPTILAACALLGIDEVYAVGGAQAIAMFAYGALADPNHPADQLYLMKATPSWLCEPVDVITGPGNIYVAAAKRYVQGICGIDAEAGPTEIGIIADASANPEYVAADLISQAEHDPNAASVLFTDSKELAQAVQKAVAKQVERTKHQERIRTALSGKQSGIILVSTLEQAIEAANAYGAEHLEIQTDNPSAVAEQIYNAGAIFVGDYSPVPLGDYLAGSNHVLPTGGTARFASGLNVMAFLKSVQQITYNRQALSGQAEALKVLALAEDLPAHAQAVNIRNRS